MALFEDRTAAGFLLAEQLTQKEIAVKDSVVCGIARGGIVVAAIIARILGMPLIPLAIKKISLAEREELGIGAMAPGNIIYWDTKMIQELELTPGDLAILAKQAEPYFKERETLLKAYTKLGNVKNKTVILVDDGVATGATVKAAAIALSKYKAEKIILAVPVIAEEVYNELLRAFSTIVTLSIAEEFESVGSYYDTFQQVSDTELVAILQEKYL